MNFLIDDVARILATPVARRKVFRLIGGLLAGGFMATIGAQRVSAACGSNPNCVSPQVCCKNTVCCSKGQCCCGTGGEGRCRASTGGVCPSGDGCSPV